MLEGERVWNVEEQKVLFQKLGYNVADWNQNDPQETAKLFGLLLAAQLRGVDVDGKALSKDDMGLLSAITGRG